MILIAAAAGLSAETFLSVSVNGGASRVPGGSPVLIAASAAGDAGATKEFALELRDASGAAVAASERPELAQSFAIDDLETTRRVWVLSPEASAALRPGRYTVRVSQGDVRSPATEFSVDLATAPDPLVLSQWEQIEGRTDRALEIVNAALTNAPAGYALLLRKSELLTARGDIGAAIRTLDQVIDAGEGDEVMEVKLLRASLVRRLLTPAR